MSMIRTVSYKASIQSDGSIYNESVEFSADMDSMPLAQSQLDDAGARVDQLRQFILNKRKQWDGARAEQPEKALVLPPHDPSVLKDAPGIKPAASSAPQRTIDGAKPMDAAAYDRNKPGWIRCPKCESTDVTHEFKDPKKKGTWQGCFDCGLFLNADGTTAEMKKKEG